MATKKHKKMDGKLVSKQKHEIAYEAKKLKVKPAAVRDAKKQVGRSRKKIEKALKG